MADESPCDRLRRARERLLLTCEEVARRIGLSASWYYDLEASSDEIGHPELVIFGLTLDVMHAGP